MVPAEGQFPSTASTDNFLHTKGREIPSQLTWLMLLYSCRMLMPGVREELGMSVSVWGSAFCSTRVSVADCICTFKVKVSKGSLFCGLIDAWRYFKYRDCSSASNSDRVSSVPELSFSPFSFPVAFCFEVDVITCFFSSKWDCSKGTVFKTVNSIENSDLFQWGFKMQVL